MVGCSALSGLAVGDRMMSEQADLFPRAPILDWLPGETLFSLVSRIHGLWGAQDAGRTASLLFGDRRRGTQHDLPGHLGDFVARTEGLLGDADALARERTLLAFYRHFMSERAEQAAVEDMVSGNIAHLKFRMGLLTSRFRANHPLKACVACMSRDVQEYGWAYWHTRHQHPGVWWCRDHGVFLRESRLKSTGVERFRWTLPREDLLMPVPPDVAQQAERIESAVAPFEQLIQALVGPGQDLRIDVARLKQCYRQQLSERGWTTEGGNIRWSRFLLEYLDFVEPLRRLPELNALPTTEEEACGQLRRAFDLSRSGGHPLWHLIVVNWLFKDVQSFLAAYALMGSDTDVEVERDVSTSSPSGPEGDPRRERLIFMLRAEGASMSEAAKSIGVDVTTAMTWAATAGYAVKKRPKTLHSGIRKRLIELLERGEEKLAAATMASVSVGTVTRTLFTEVGLHERWREACRRRTQDEHRLCWQRLLDDYGGSGVKVMRGLAPATYGWLYRNDREWLQAHTPMPVLRAADARRDAVWLQRDEDLRVAVCRAAVELASESGRQRVFLWELYQAVPVLKPKLRALNRLPLTRKVIEFVLAWRTQQGALEDLIGY